MICTSCERNEEVSLDIPIVMCLPVSSVQMDAPMRRVPGDPGLAERFFLPRYAYIFVMQKVGDEWSVINKTVETLADEDWEKTRYTGYMKTEGDSIFKYTKKMHLLFSSKGVKGSVYGIVSYEELTFDKDLNTITNLEDLLELKFNSNTLQGSLQHIYSSPYDYNINGEYYCAFDNTNSNVEYIDLMLYHVAAKVDINWTVPTDKRIKADPEEAVRLTYMQAVNLFNGWAYCFKPMANVVDPLPTTGYSRQIVSPGDVGRWWEGRDYFYTIPYTTPTHSGYFPLQMVLKTNGSAGTGYRPTLYMEMDDSPFVPWLRADFTINNRLEDGTTGEIIVPKN